MGLETVVGRDPRTRFTALWFSLHLSEVPMQLCAVTAWLITHAILQFLFVHESIEVVVLASLHARPFGSPFVLQSIYALLWKSGL